MKASSKTKTKPEIVTGGRTITETGIAENVTTNVASVRMNSHKQGLDGVQQKKEVSAKIVENDTDTTFVNNAKEQCQKRIQQQ